MDFNAKSNFKDRKLVIKVKNVTGVYDVQGNMMHENSATYLIQNYIKMDDAAKSIAQGSSAASK